MMKKVLKNIIICGLLATITMSSFACKKDKKPETNVQPDNEIGLTDNLLIENGKCDYKILLPEKPTKTEEYASEELNFILKNTINSPIEVVKEGASLPEKFISIGDTKVAKEKLINTSMYDLGNGGYLIFTLGKNVYINSDKEAGKLNGVYGFCEENLGYRYYSNDEIKFTKQSGNVYLKDFCVIKKPTFDGRNVHSWHTVYDYQNASRLKANSITTSWDEKYGSASTWATLHDTSNVCQLLPLADYYNDHPDWYILSKEYVDQAPKFPTMSKNDMDHIAGKFSQICYTKGLYDDSKGGMFDTYVTNLKKYIKNGPDAQLFMLGMGDNTLKCNCEKCAADRAKYGESGLVMRFANKVTREINRWLKEESGMASRKIYIVVFAYLTAMEAPVKYVDRKPVPIDESVVAEDNLCVRIAPLVNSNFYWDLMDEEHNTFIANNIKAWKQITNHFTIWDYRVHFNQLLAPYPWWNTVKSNLEIYKEMNVYDIFHQGYYAVPTSFGRMDDYISASLMFDIDQDVNVLINDFIDNYYKECAPYIREYLTYLQLHYEDHLVKEKYTGSVYSTVITKKYWPLESLVQIKNIFDKAYKAIEKLPEERKQLLKRRVDFESRFYRYALLELYIDYFTKDEVKAMINGWEEANKYEPITEHGVRQSMEEKEEAWRNYLR